MVKTKVVSYPKRCKTKSVPGLTILQCVIANTSSEIKIYSDFFSPSFFHTWEMNKALKKYLQAI